MGVIHVGAATTLAAVPKADISNADIAYIWLNSFSVKMIYDSTATNATDISDGCATPYYIRPDDYGAGPGVWVEAVGDDQPERWNAAQIVGSQLKSINWGATTGSCYDLDNAWFKLGGSDVDADGSASGVFIGFDNGVPKMFVGGTQGVTWVDGDIVFKDTSDVLWKDGDAISDFSYIKWDGSKLSIRLASGETFDLFGSMNIYGGGDIVLTGSDTDPGIIKFNGATYQTTLSINASGGLFSLLSVGPIGITIESDTSQVAIIGYLQLHKTDVDGAVEADLWYDASEDKLKFKTAAGVETITSG